MDGTLAQFADVPLAASCRLQNSAGNDFAIHFQLADILKRLTCQLVRLVHGGYLLWIKGQFLENPGLRLDMMLLVAGASASSRLSGPDELSDDRKSPAMSRAIAH